jgi:hypothetical protein
MARRKRHGVGWLLAGLLATGCGDPTGTVERVGDAVQGNGTVRWYDFEGGFYAIRGADDVTYDPTNLPSEYKSPGIEVWFSARILPVGSYHMAGPVVEIRQIRRR